MQKTPELETEEFELNSKVLVSTFESLSYIQSKNKDAKIYFIAGSDKLKIMWKWRNIKEFLTQFNILVAARNGDDLETLVDNFDYPTGSAENNPFLFLKHRKY